jgi:hypothetical protein
MQRWGQMTPLSLASASESGLEHGTKSGKNVETSVRVSYKEAMNRGLKGSCEQWRHLLQLGPHAFFLSLNRSSFCLHRCVYRQRNLGVFEAILKFTEVQKNVS